jgi:hypothetical protein
MAATNQNPDKKVSGSKTGQSDFRMFTVFEFHKGQTLPSRQKFLKDVLI